MNGSWHQTLAPVLEYALPPLRAILILVVGWLAIRFLVGPLRRLLERSRFDPSVASFLANSVRSALLVFILLAVLQQLGVQTTSLLTLLGAAGLAIALSLQGSLANFASGLLVLAFRMVRVGDQIELGDIRGQVTELLPFHVVLVTVDNQRITLPNTMLTSSAVRNHSVLTLRRAQWTLPLSSRDNLAETKQALLARLRAEPRILSEPAPQAYVQEWGDDKRVLVITAWTAVDNYLSVQQGMLEALGLILEEMRKNTRVV
jgi:small conductance mechanosensitive channel